MFSPSFVVFLQPTEKFISLETADAQHMTPLHCAAMFDQGHVVQYMVGEVTSEMLVSLRDSLSPYPGIGS